VKPLIVGQAPSRNNPAPFSGGMTGRRIAHLLDVRYDALPALVRWENLLDEWPGKSGKGDRFDIDAARAAATALVEREAHRAMRDKTEPRLLLLGRAVTKSFGIFEAEPFTFYTAGPLRIAMLPHPSGINHFWNSPENVERAARFLRETILPATAAAS